MSKDDKNRLKGVTAVVNHPSHYQHIKIGHNGENETKFEAIDIIQGVVSSLDLGSEYSGFLWQTLKYILRAPFKKNMIEDLEKSEWYLDRLIQTMKRDDKNG